MKKILSSLLLLFSIVTISQAEFEIPRDRDGAEAINLQSVGVNVLTVSYSSAASIVRGSSIAVYGVMTGTKTISGATSGIQAFVQLRSSNTATVTGELLVPPIEFSSSTRNTFVWFDPPVVAPDGLSINISTVADAQASVFYRFLATGTLENFWIPTDNRGNKAQNPQFYGVKAASSVIAGATADTLGTEGLDMNTDELVIDDRTGLLYGVFPSTGPTTSYVVFEDSGTATTTPDLADFIPPFFYRTAIFIDTTHGTSGNQPFYFKYPLIYTLGLTQNRDSNVDRFRVFTKPRSNLR